jgi:hypothetical protein
MKQINPGSRQYYSYAVVMALSMFIVLATSCKKYNDDPKKPVISSVGEGKGYVDIKIISWKEGIEQKCFITCKIKGCNLNGQRKIQNESKKLWGHIHYPFTLVSSLFTLKNLQTTTFLPKHLKFRIKLICSYNIFFHIANVIQHQTDTFYIRQQYSVVHTLAINIEGRLG